MLTRSYDETPPHAPETRTFIRISSSNGRLTLWLDETALEDDILRGYDGASEQCGGCGSDIIESGQLIANQQKIACADCGATYQIRTI